MNYELKNWRYTMGWKFWKKDRKKDEDLHILTKDVDLIKTKFNILEGLLRGNNDKFDEILKEQADKFDEILDEQDDKSKEVLQVWNSKFDEINENMESSGEQIQKLLRLQYKSHQESLKEFDQIKENINTAMDYNEKYIAISREKDNLIKEKEFLIGNYIKWLDDVDLVYDSLNIEEQNGWVKLLQSWQKQIIGALVNVGVYETQVLDKSFNPTTSESMGTRDKEANKVYLPYQVVAVLERGFASEEGILLRKAKVITIKEEMEKDEE